MILILINLNSKYENAQRPPSAPRLLLRLLHFSVAYPPCYYNPAPMFGPRKDPAADVRISAATASLNSVRPLPFICLQLIYATNSFLLYWAPLRCEICFKFPLMFLFLQPGANIQAAKGSDSRRAPQIAFCYFGPLSDARFVLTSPSCFCSPAPMFGPRKDPTADVHIPAAAATLSRSRSFPFFVWS